MTRHRQPCLTCGTPSQGAYCDEHRIDTRAMRDNSHAYRIAASEAKRSSPTCWLCGQPFTELDPATADHVEPLIHGGDLLGELRPAHRSCNSRRGAQAAA
jgi:5-methylcytosine-specific restriction endonuclease McrA